MPPVFVGEGLHLQSVMFLSINIEDTHEIGDNGTFWERQLIVLASFVVI
jgi:hypothetical protein